MVPIDATNILFTLAADLVNNTSRDIFLTGKAGTGKTTFLKYIRDNCPKRMAIVAPTGVAAINAGGVTIHSFFQLPLSPFIPDSKGFVNGESTTNKHSLIGRLRLSSERKKIIQDLELLIIDEISMVRCDILDAVDTVLRYVRNNPKERFGGLQVLFIGDMYQLAPVVKEMEWSFLVSHYDSPYFFDSRVMKESPPVYIEFTKIYRQTDEQFIDILNQVRNNEVAQASLQSLHERYRPEFRPDPADGFIILTTHNEKARNINIARLNKLEGKLFEYRAETDGDFAETAYPADSVLQLKVGAQVMFLKNDTDRLKRYFNGKIGIVSSLEDDKIMVECVGEDEPIEVGPEKWDQIKYSMNNTTRQLEEEVLGSFKQYPLRLAWAITIHKSQGLTFEKAIIDAGDAFAPGQVYVALSRCTSLGGMVLYSKIRSNSLCTDPRVVAFSKQASSSDDISQLLGNAKKEHQKKLLSSLFDCRNIVSEMNSVKNYMHKHHSSFNADALPWIETISGSLESIQLTFEKFHPHLVKMFAMPASPENNKVLQEKIAAGAGYFVIEFNKIIEQLQLSPVSTDSRLHAKEFNESFKEIFAQLSLKKYLLEDPDATFDLPKFYARKNRFVIEPYSINAYAATSKSNSHQAHPILYQQLKKLRDEICNKKNLPVYLVLGSRGLDEMATFLPQTMDELEQINGFGKAKLKNFGEDFLQIIKDYSAQNGLSSAMRDKEPKRKKRAAERPGDTKAESFRLFSEGKSIPEIAGIRKLTAGTIEGHLTHYVLEGKISIDRLVSKEKIALIAPELQGFDGGSITPIKTRLGDDISFGDIRLVMAWLDHEKSLTA